MTSFSLKIAFNSRLCKHLLLSYFTFDFDRVYGRLDVFIGACFTDSVAFNVAVPFQKEFLAIRRAISLNETFVLFC